MIGAVTINQRVAMVTPRAIGAIAIAHPSRGGRSQPIIRIPTLPPRRGRPVSVPISFGVIIPLLLASEFG